jgi:hypothetical protein
LGKLRWLIAASASSTEHSFHCNFPEAAIYIQKRELDFALQQHGNPSYNHSLLQKLHLLPNIVWMNDDKGLISEEISFEVTGGHSPYHQSFLIRSGRETVFYGAENLPPEVLPENACRSQNGS